MKSIFLLNIKVSKGIFYIFNIGREKRMKKKVVLVILFIVLLLTSVNVYAAKGGKYTFEEGNLKLTVPSNYVIFTRDTTSKDADIKKYGIDLTELKEQFESGNVYADMITDKKSEIIVMIYEDSSSRDIPNLTEYLKKYPDEFDKMNSSDIIKDFKKSGIEISSMTLYKNSSYYYIHFEGYNSIDKNYAEMYITTINGKFVGFSTIPLADTKITSAQKTALKNFVDKNVSFYDVQPLPESAKPGESIWSRVLARVCLAAIIGIAGIIIAFIKRKANSVHIPKETAIEKLESKDINMPQDSANSYKQTIEEALALDINFQTTNIEYSQFTIGSKEKMYDNWINSSSEAMSKIDVKEGYFLLNYFIDNDIEKSAKIAEKLLEVNKLNHYSDNREKRDIIKLANSYNDFNALTFLEEYSFNKKNIKNEFIDWQKTLDSQLTGELLKESFKYLDYFTEAEDLETAESIANRIIKLCAEPKELFNKAISLYSYEPMKEERYTSLSKAVDDFLLWQDQKDKDLSINDIQIGYLLLYYFQKEGYLSLSKKTSQKLIEIMESRSDIVVKENLAYDNNIVSDSTLALAAEPQTDGTEIIKAADNIDKEDKVAEHIHIFCSKCGSMLLADSIFCNKCGTKIF